MPMNRINYPKPIGKSGDPGVLLSSNGNIEAPMVKVGDDDDTPKFSLGTPNQSTRKLHSINLNLIKDISDIADDTQSDLSEIFNLKVKANDSDLNGSADVRKPQPRPPSTEKQRGRNAITKQSLIIMNNLNLGQIKNPTDMMGDDSVKKGSTYGNTYGNELESIELCSICIQDI